MKDTFLALLVCLICLVASTWAQPSTAAVKRPTPSVNSRNNYSRIIAVVPIIGAGTMADPKRPKYAPWPPPKGDARTDIIGFSNITTDDGKFAIVELVARDRTAFQAILADKSVTVFEKDKDKNKGKDIEAVLQSYKKGFNLEKFGLPVR